MNKINKDESTITFLVSAPFWGVGQIFNDIILDNKNCIIEGIDDVRDGCNATIKLSDLINIEPQLVDALNKGYTECIEYLKERNLRPSQHKLYYHDSKIYK